MTKVLENEGELNEKKERKKTSKEERTKKRRELSEIELTKK